MSRRVPWSACSASASSGGTGPGSKPNRTFPREWRDAAGSSENVIYMTARALEELHQELLALLLPRYRERLTDPSLRPPDAVPVEFLVLAYPQVDLAAIPALPPRPARRRGAHRYRGFVRRHRGDLAERPHAEEHHHHQADEGRREYDTDGQRHGVVWAH